MNFSERIRELRKAAGYTQQKIADMLGTTCQSVSRWETGVSMPDISILPSICSLLGTSADELLGINEQKRRDEIAALLAKTSISVLQSREDLVRNAETLRQALRRYHGEVDLMKRLCEVLQGIAEYTADDEDASAYHALQNEQLALYDLLLRRVTEGEERFRLIADKCMLLHDMGRQDEAILLAQDLPSGKVTAQGTLQYILTGEKLAEHCRKSIPENFSDLILSILSLIRCKNESNEYLHSADERLAMLNALIDTCEAFWGKAGAPGNALRILYILSIVNAAAIYAQSGCRHEALAYCEKAADRLEGRIDEESETLRRLLSNEETGTSSEQEAALRSDRQNVLDKLSQPAFDAIRNDERFIALTRKLQV